MKAEDIYKKEINDLISRRGRTKFHITGIRHCDFKDMADDFIRDAAQKMQNVILMPEEANQYDQASVVCRSGEQKDWICIGIRFGEVSNPCRERRF